MYIGLLTARFADQMNLEQIASWAAEAGYAALEVHTRHIDAKAVLADGGAAVRKVLDATGLKISSIAHYSIFNRNSTAEQYAEQMRDVLAAAEVLGLDTVCTLAGFPEEGKSKMETIREVLPPLFAPLADQAQKRGLKIAFENWFATNLQHLDHFQALLEAVPNENVGFNFDPSHLHWQGIDYLAAVAEFKDRIFHTHAKDVATYAAKLARIGVLEGAWWRYVIPGFGEIDWGRYILALREIGYDGAVSVEHEDSSFDACEGFEKALRHLSQFV